MTVFFDNIVDDLSPAFLAKVDVEVRHADALGVEEALEQQVVFYGVDVCYADTVGAQRARAGASPGTHGDAVGFGVLHEVVDDKIVVDKAHV